MTYEGHFDYAELNELIQSLEGLLTEVRRSGCEAAKAERDYRVALRKEMLEQRAHGTPVSIISDVCRGITALADLKCARDCQEALYKASIEAVNVAKLKIKTISAQIDREWRAS